jgi:hypothetical protein
MLADTYGIKIDDADKEELTEKFSTMPPRPEVPASNRAFALITASVSLPSNTQFGGRSRLRCLLTPHIDEIG